MQLKVLVKFSSKMVTTSSRLLGSRVLIET